MNVHISVSKLRRLLGCVALVAVVSAASHAQAGTRLIGLGANSQSLAPFTLARLIEIDTQTGNTTQIGSDFILEEGFGANLAADSAARLYNLFSRYADGFETEGWLNEISLTKARSSRGRRLRNRIPSCRS